MFDVLMQINQKLERRPLPAASLRLHGLPSYPKGSILIGLHWTPLGRSTFLSPVIRNRLLLVLQQPSRQPLKLDQTRPDPESREKGNMTRQPPAYNRSMTVVPILRLQVL